MQANTILHCFDGNGTFDVERYLRHRAKRNAVATEELVNLALVTAEEEQQVVNRRRERSRTKDIRGQMPKKRCFG